MTTDKLPEWVMVPRYPALEAAECLRLTAVAGKRDCEAHGYAHDFDRSIDAAAELLAAIAAAPAREVVVDESLAKRVLAYYVEICVMEHHDDAPPALRVEAMQRALSAALTHPQGDDDGK